MITCPACFVENSNSSKFCSECGSALKPEYEATYTFTAEKASVDSDTSSDSSVHGRFLPGTKLANRYRIVSLLGKGGMGEVYRADDLKLGQTVALKFLPKELANDLKRLEYFHGEVRLTRQISHPNVCRVYDIGEVDCQQFLSMEFIDGEDLKSLLRRIGRLPKDKGIQIAQQLCAGLAAAHAQGVLHRDFKPANIMVDGRGQVRITDFGLAQLSSEDEQEVVGTPTYMAPEQLIKGEATVQSDIYALGLVLFEMFTGERVHKSNSVAELRERHAVSSSTNPPSRLLDDVDPAVQRLIQQCLEHEPENRPKSVTVAAASLPGGDPLAAALAAGETPAPELVAAVGGAGAIPLARAAICFAVVVAGVMAYTWLRSYSPPGFDVHPGQLVADAEAVLRDAGLGDVLGSPHVAYGFRYDEDLISLHGEDNGPTKAQPAEFWYRRGPRPLTPVSSIAVAGPAQTSRSITLRNPPLSLEGMVSLRLSARGTLRELVYVTEQETEARKDPLTPESGVWADLFKNARLVFDQFVAEERSTWRPPFSASHQFAWKLAKGGETAGPSVRVLAASDQGRVTYFQVIHPWTSRQWTVDRTSGGSARRMFSFPEQGRVVRGVILYVVLALSLLAVRHNARLGRCDIRGAWRVCTAASGLAFLGAVLVGSHLPDLETELLLLTSSAIEALWVAFLAWILYAGVEPLVRRVWPDALIAWTRVVKGRLRDPLVGRDLLYGAVVASCVMPIGGVLAALQWHFMDYYHLPLQVFLSTRFAFALFPFCVLNGVMTGLFCLVSLLILRIALRNSWLAAGGLLILGGGLGLTAGDELAEAFMNTLGAACVVVLQPRGIEGSFRQPR